MNAFEAVVNHTPGVVDHTVTSIEGDTIDSRRVEKIEQGAVVLRMNDSTVKLVLSPKPWMVPDERSSDAD